MGGLEAAAAAPTRISKEEEARPRKVIAWLMPDGTFTKQGVDLLSTQPGYEDAQLMGVGSIDEMFEAVQTGMATHALVPVENSTAGHVKDTHGNFFGYKVSQQKVRDSANEDTNDKKLKIQREVVLPVRLTGFCQDPSQVTTLMSKDIVEKQSRKKTKKQFPNAKWEHINSTALAVQRAVEDPRICAVASPIAASAQKLKGLVEIPDLNDRLSNATTFALITTENDQPEPTGNDKTTFIMTIPDVAGSLLSALDVLAENGVDLNKLKSIGKEDGTVSFLVSADGHLAEERFGHALEALSTKPNTEIDVLGSYPKGILELPEDIQEDYDFPNAIELIKEDAANGEEMDATKTIVAFTLHDRPGALSDAIRVFAEEGVNLSKIDSQTSGIHDEHIFYLAFENVADKTRKEYLLANLAAHCHDVIELPRAA